MSSSDPILEAYKVGKLLAHNDFEKQAFVAPLGKALKFLFMGGHLGKPGSFLSKLSPHHVGTPLGFGAFSAATADEGERGSAFVKGLAGGAAFGAIGMPIGRALGARLFAPGFRGANTKGMIKSLGFSDEAASNISASQQLNKLLHGSTQRRLSSGNLSNAQRKKLHKAWKDIPTGTLPEELAAQHAKLTSQLGTTLKPINQKELGGQLSAFTKSLNQLGYQSAPAGAKAKLKGIRFAKGVGAIGGGMGLGITADHKAQELFNTTPASVFDSSKGLH